MGFFDDAFEAWKGLVVAGIGFLLTLTPLAPVGSLLIGYGLSMTLKALAPLDQRNANFQANRVSTDANINVVLGEAVVGGAVLDYRVQDPDNKFLITVLAVSHGSRDGSGVNDIEEIFADGELAVPAGADHLRADGFFVTDNNVVSFYQDYLDYGIHLGEDNQQVDANLHFHHPNKWPTTSRLRGIAYIATLIENEPEKFPGVPTWTTRVEGIRAFDPRDSTWKWTKNPALLVREALLNNIWGKGEHESSIDDGATKNGGFAWAANKCDELVSTPAGSQPRHEVGGVWDTSLTVQQNLEILLQSFNAHLVWQNGKYRLVIRDTQAPSGFVFDDDMVVGRFEWKLAGLRDDGANSCVVSYIEPAAQQADGSWTQDHVQKLHWPRTDDANPYLAEDGGFDAPITIELPYVRDRYRALQIASTRLKELREGDTFRFLAREAAMEVEVGVVAELDIPALGNLAPLPFWVLRVDHVGGGIVGVTGMKYNAAAYQLPTLTTIADPPDSGVPRFQQAGDPTGLAVGAIRRCVDGTTTAVELVATWTNPANNPHDRMELRYRNDDVGGGTPGPWVVVQPYPGDATSAQFFIPDFDDQATYRVGIRSIAPSGSAGNWVEATVDVSAVACTLDVAVGGNGTNHGAVSGSINISFLDGWIQVIEPNGDVDVTLVDTFDGSRMRPLQLIVLQNGGPWNITVAVENSGTILWSPDGTVPDLTQTADADDSFSFSAIAQDLVYGQQMGRDYG